MISRALFFVFVLTPYILVSVPLQFVVTRLNLPRWNVLPRLFHRLCCMFLGLKVSVIGQPDQSRPTLLVCNHISWTDVLAIGSIANFTFVAKSEVAKWPFVGFMASMQKTIYVDRKRRSDAGRTSTEMAARLADGGAVLLFAEGQTDTGTHVLPFRSALVGAAQAAMKQAGAIEVSIQPVTIAYTHLQGLPLSRNDLALIKWMKSKSMGENIAELLSGGVKRATVAFGTPVPLASSDNRKEVTKRCEGEVRRMLVSLNRDRLPKAKAAE